MVHLHVGHVISDGGWGMGDGGWGMTRVSLGKGMLGRGKGCKHKKHGHSHGGGWKKELFAKTPSASRRRGGIALGVLCCLLLLLILYILPDEASSLRRALFAPHSPNLRILLLSPSAANTDAIPQAIHGIFAGLVLLHSSKPSNENEIAQVESKLPHAIFSNPGHGTHVAPGDRLSILPASNAPFFSLRTKEGAGRKGRDNYVVLGEEIDFQADFRVELEPLAYSYAVLTLCPLLDPHTTMSSSSRGYELCSVDVVRTWPRST